MHRMNKMWKPNQSIEICLKLLVGKPCQKFIVPFNGLERIDVWIHEFSDLSIKTWFELNGSQREVWLEDNAYNDWPLNTIYMRKLITIQLSNGQKQTHRIDHVLTSLVMISNLGSHEDEDIYLIQPDEYRNFVIGLHIIDID